MLLKKLISLTICFLENVDPDTLEKFIDMYYLDFVLFGYNIQEINAILQDKIKVFKVKCA